ncbi:MAG: CHASE2 domain-containing protein [Proteobacteria bacterium]|nr:CHASE2 domain-containing protein [Pseudomonadota bacterium]
MRRFVPRLLVMGLVSMIYFMGGLESAEHWLMDLRFSLVQRDASKQLIFVEIDERSLRLLEVWPWPRSHHAELIERLNSAGARNIAVDIDFSSRSTPAHDALLEQALEQAERRVILPAFKQYVGWERDLSAMAETGPLPRFATKSRLGSVVMRPETDSLIRRIMLSLSWGGTDLPGFPFLLADTMGPTSAELYIDYGIRPGTIPRISYVDVLRGEFPPRLFQGRDVIVGASAIELGDYLSVPLHLTIPGSALIALSAETLRQGRALRRTGALPTLAVMALLTLLLAPHLAQWSWHRGLLMLGGGSLGLVAATVGLQKATPISLDIAPWLLAPWLCYGQSMIALIDRQTLRLFHQRMAVLHRGAMMRRFVESSFDGIIVINPMGQISLFNHAAETMLGYRGDELIDKPPDPLFDFSGNGNEPFRISDLQNLDTPVPPVREGLGLRKDGTTFVMEITIQRAVLQISRNPLERRVVPRTHHFLTIRDVTQRRLLENTQRQATEEAIAASRAKSEFMAAVSHELRTPLNAIIGFSEMIKDELLGPIENEKYKAYSEDINSSGNQLLGIINDILDIAKIEAGNTILHEDMIDTEYLVASTIRLVSARPEAEGLTITIESEANLPGLKADARAVKQVLLNLLSNAVKFTDEGTITVTIATIADGSLQFAVSDTGMGIAQDEIEKLTQPFYQVDSSLARKFEGTGLGLALSNSLMELHDGELIIESVEGEGTTVTCRFPPERVETATDGQLNVS